MIFKTTKLVGLAVATSLNLRFDRVDFDDVTLGFFGAISMTTTTTTTEVTSFLLVFTATPECLAEKIIVDLSCRRALKSIFSVGFRKASFKTKRIS